MFFPLLSLACTLVRFPGQAESLPELQPQNDVDLATTVSVESIDAATWAVPLEGLLDLTDPAAVDLEPGDHDILVMVHVIEHPVHGRWLVDSGVSQNPGERVADAGAILGSFVESMVVLTSTAELLEEGRVEGVLLTHLHMDHVLGLPDLPLDTPLWTGPYEGSVRSGENLLLRPFNSKLFAGRTLSAFDPAQAQAFGPVDQAWDLFGDGSVWVLSTPGHTAGSIAVWARSDAGPVLMTGDTSHTRWGWEHDVAPGTYTADHQDNVESLGQLRALEEMDPNTTVIFGHER
ncbi:MAG: N-acyl homoserine lactone hydrolase [Cognaticolwellia sp.]|jgi:N-acyl homoserine lactone hydrolase